VITRAVQQTAFIANRYMPPYDSRANALLPARSGVATCGGFSRPVSNFGIMLVAFQHVERSDAEEEVCDGN
jgi:hypothetical protein